MAHTRASVDMTAYKTEYLIELAYAAYKANKGYEKHTRRHSENPPTYSNKELIAYTASAHNEQSPFIPEDFTPLVVTDQDRADVAEGKKHMRRYTLLAMGDLPQFEADLFAAYSSDEMPIGRIGLLAYLPAFIERQVKDRLYKQRIKTEFTESKHLVGDKLEPSEIEILKVIPLNGDWISEPAYMHFGAIGNNLVCFTNKLLYAVGETYDIVARIKGTDVERDTKTPMTRLNYVKLRSQKV
jgi:hypothetical protein